MDVDTMGVCSMKVKYGDIFSSENSSVYSFNLVIWIMDIMGTY